MFLLKSAVSWHVVAGTQLWVTQQNGSAFTEDVSPSSKRRWARVPIVCLIVFDRPPGGGPSYRSCQTEGEERPFGEDWGRSHLGGPLGLLPAEDGAAEEDVPSLSSAGPGPCPPLTQRCSTLPTRGDPSQQPQNANTVLDPASWCWRTTDNSVWSEGKVKSCQQVISRPILVWQIPQPNSILYMPPLL